MYRFVTFYVDGGVRQRNPSPVGVYWSIRRETRGQQPIIVRRESSEYRTNNEAEWLALREALLYAREHHPRESIVIYSDSKLVVNQFNGFWAVNVARLSTLRRECRAIAAELKWVAVSWRGREIMVEKLGH